VPGALSIYPYKSYISRLYLWGLSYPAHDHWAGYRRERNLSLSTLLAGLSQINGLLDS